MSASASVPTSSAVVLLAVERDLNPPCILDDVIVREDVPPLIDDRTGAGTLARCREHEEPVVAHRAGGDVHHAAVGTIVHPDVGQFLGRQAGRRQRGIRHECVGLDSDGLGRRKRWGNWPAVVLIHQPGGNGPAQHGTCHTANN